MATITVVRPKVVYPGPHSFFSVFDEAASVNTAANGILVLELSSDSPTGDLVVMADDPTVGTVVGQNVAATANAGSAGTDVTCFVWTPGAIIEINTNATGTDPDIGDELDAELGATAAPNQEFQANLTVGTASSITSLGTAVFIASPTSGSGVTCISPRDASGDTNVRIYARLRAPFLAFYYGA